MFALNTDLKDNWLNRQKKKNGAATFYRMNFSRMKSLKLQPNM